MRSITMAMWRILLLQIQRQLRRHIHIIDWFIYALVISSIGLLNGFLISIYKYRYDKHDAISIFAINRTRYLMTTASKDDPIGELRLESWLNAANNRRLPNYVDVILHNDLESWYFWRDRWGRKDKKERLYCRIWSVTIINGTLINSGTSYKNTLVIFTGGIDSCTTDDQSCVVLGHYLEDRPSSSLNNILSFLAEINEDEPFETKPHFDITARELEFEADIVTAFLASRLCVDTRPSSIKRVPLAPVEGYPIGKRHDLTRNHWYSSKGNSTHPERMARYDSLLKTLPRFFETSFYWWSHL